jgi:hypothetical protein
VYAFAGTGGGLEHAVRDGAGWVTGGEGAVGAGVQDDGFGERCLSFPAELAVFGCADLKAC